MGIVADYYKEARIVLEKELKRFDPCHVFTLGEITRLVNKRLGNKEFLTTQMSRFLSYKRTHFQIFQDKHSNYILLRRDFK